MNFYTKYMNYKAIVYIDNWKLDVRLSTATLLCEVQHNGRGERDMSTIHDFNTILARCNRCFVGSDIDTRYTLSSISI